MDRQHHRGISSGDVRSRRNGRSHIHDEQRKYRQAHGPRRAADGRILGQRAARANSYSRAARAYGYANGDSGSADAHYRDCDTRVVNSDADSYGSAARADCDSDNRSLVSDADSYGSATRADSYSDNCNTVSYRNSASAYI